MSKDNLSIKNQKISNWQKELLNLVNTQKYKEALDYCQNAKEDYSKDSVTLTIKGFAHSNLKEYTEALKCYSEALSIDISNSSAWYNLGVTYTQMPGENEEKALHCYDKVLEISPNRLDALYNKSIILLYSTNTKKGNFKYNEAIHSFNLILKALPHPEYSYIKEEDIWFYKGNCYKKLEEYSKAIECYNIALKINPNFLGARAKKLNVLYTMELTEVFKMNEKSERGLESNSNFRELAENNVDEEKTFTIEHLKILNSLSTENKEAVMEIIKKAKEKENVLNA
ncbi:MAG: tetratricopeptide repeat protein [Sphingobacteriia bacterium]|nr:tetratricopeptide repeat protein [Sphingobacteriia bacterium]